jgi:hypothetical protein
MSIYIYIYIYTILLSRKYDETAWTNDVGIAHHLAIDENHNGEKFFAKPA